MAKIRTLDLLSQSVEEEYKWRSRELEHLKKLIPLKREDKQKVLLRAAITLLYAHWEGFIRKVANDYYEFVSYQKHKIGDFNASFIAVLLRKEANDLIDNKRISQQKYIFDKIRTDLEKNANFPNESPIKTSNLNFEILEDICSLLCVDIKRFETKRIVINEHLLTRRNKVAHGHYLEIDLDDFNQTYTHVLGMMEIFKDEALNSAALKKYLA